MSGCKLPLPLLLAGPIVRRTEQDCVWIWVATSVKVAAAKARVDRRTPDNRPRSTFPLKPVTAGDLRPVALGEHLFVTLIPFRPARGIFSSDEVYVYDLELSLEIEGGVKKYSLKDLLLSDRIAYEPFKGPTFRMPARWRPMVQGSCRRPGAYGEDAFLALDDMLARVAKNPGNQQWEYPQALFLTGDQIYADDVTGPLFAAVTELAPLLLGTTETVPIPSRLVSALGGITDGGRSPSVPLSHLVYTKPEQKKAAPVETRRGFVLKVAQFSTDDGEGHLLGLSEYAAMYLLVWSGVLCRCCEVETRGEPKGGGDEHLAGFTQACSAARRVLANLPTYMIFDDHDITDDWNLSKRWEEDTNNATAQRIIANALGAYWAFQAIGNTPDLATDGKLVDSMGQFVELLTGHSEYADPGVTSLLFSTAFVKKKKDWSFLAPTMPKSLFVDTRTQRDLRAGYQAANLLPGDALDRVRIRLPPQPGTDLILVVPCPIQPDRVMMVGQLKKLQAGTETARLEYDAEHFWLDPAGPYGLIDTIARYVRPRSCYVFSGDVHHGYVMSSIFLCFSDGKKFALFYKALRAFMRRGEAPSQDYRVLQRLLEQPAVRGLRVVLVTSSPIKNYSSHYGRDLKSFREEEVPEAPGHYYALGEAVLGKEWYAFPGPYDLEGSYLDVHRHHAVMKELGHRPFRNVERSVLAPHFCMIGMDHSKALARFLGAWRTPAKKQLRYWTATVEVDLEKIIVPQS